MAERGLSVDHTTIYRWVQHSAPELEKRCRPHLKETTDSWRVDETSMKMKKEWLYLYRAVDSRGNTLDFFLSVIRDAEAAKRFFCKALHACARSASQACSSQEPVAQPPSDRDCASVPRVITVDKNAASPKAMADLKAAGILPASVERRQVKYRGNLIEQDHRFIKRLRHPRDGLFLV